MSFQAKALVWAIASIICSAAGPPAFAQAEANTIQAPATAMVATGPAEVSSIEVDELVGFDELSTSTQALIRAALELTKQGLTYTSRSADPKHGGMDCSGAIYFLLRSQGVQDVPRQSDQMAEWLIKQGVWVSTAQAKSLDDPIFAGLRPGDLLFWAGVEKHKTRRLPVSHVMLYLGKQVKTGKRVIFGSSDGRSYAGQRRRGVSVFDFAFPKPDAKVRFFGYGRPAAKPAQAAASPRQD